MSRYDQICLSTDALESIMAQLQNTRRELQSQQSRIRSVCSQLDRESGSEVRVSGCSRLNCGASVGSGKVKSVLSDYRDAVRSCSDGIEDLSKAVGRVRDLLADTERGLISGVNAISNNEGSMHDQTSDGTYISAASGEKSDKIEWRLDELLKNIITSMGTAGDLGYSVFSAFAGGPAGLAQFLVKGTECLTQWKDIAKTFKNFKRLKNFGTGYAVKTYAKKLFGLNSYARANKFSVSGANTVSGRFVSNWTRSGTFVKGMKNPVTWIMEGIDKGIENYQEYSGGYKDGGTAVAEWVSETTVAVTATVATTALVVAAIPSAPVLVVGAIGGTIVWGVDTLWANTVGKGKDEDGGNEGLIETAGESIVEGGKWIMEKSRENGEKIGDFLYDGYEKLQGYFAGESSIQAEWGS